MSPLSTWGKSPGSSTEVLQDCFSQSLVKKSFHSVWATRQLACKRMTTILILDSAPWVMVLFKLAYSLGHCAYSCTRVLSMYSRTQRVLAYSACTPRVLTRTRLDLRTAVARVRLQLVFSCCLNSSIHCSHVGVVTCGNKKFRIRVHNKGRAPHLYHRDADTFYAGENMSDSR